MERGQPRRWSALRASVALGALALAAVLSAAALAGDRGGTPAPIEVAAGAEAGGADGGLLIVEPTRVEALDGADTATGAGDGPDGSTEPSADPTTTVPPPDGASGDTSSDPLLPGLDQVTVPSLPLPGGSPSTTTDPIGDLLGLLPLPGTTSTTAPGGDDGPLPGLTLPDLGLGG